MTGVKCEHSAWSSNKAGDDDDYCHLADESQIACHSFRGLSRGFQGANSVCLLNTQPPPAHFPGLGLQTGPGLWLMNWS